MDCYQFECVLAVHVTGRAAASTNQAAADWNQTIGTLTYSVSVSQCPELFGKKSVKLTFNWSYISDLERLALSGQSQVPSDWKGASSQSQTLH